MPSSPSPAGSFTRLQRAALIAGLVLLAWALAAHTFGGVTITIGGMRLSSRAAWRPAVAGAVVIGLMLWRSTLEQRRQTLPVLAQWANRLATGVAATTAVLMALTSALYGTHVASGADSSGYISQSALWARGETTTAAAVLTDDPWPARGVLVAPLGYRPSRTENRLGPTYAPGLPWMMAASGLLAGEAGRYVWTPLLAGLLVWGTFVLARRHAPPAVAASAAALVASSPPMLFAAMQTMSDLPVAALWLWSLLAAPSSGTLGAGLLAGLALAVRPNLVLSAAGVWAASAIEGSWSTPMRLRRALVFAAPMAVAALSIAAVNTALWGGPGVSGYGAPADLFTLENILPNVSRLWRWTIETRGYWTWLGLVALVVLSVRPDGRRWWPALSLCLGVLASYLAYAQFEEWWYLRFYLPLWPFTAAAAVVGCWQAGRRWSADGATLAIVIGAALITLAGLADARARTVFDLWRGEQRYSAVGHFIGERAPAQGVVLALQHSGSAAYYGQRPIVRFDELPADALDARCEAWAAAGRSVWLAVDDLEESAFRARFASQRRGRLDWAPLGEARVETRRVRVYDLADPTRAVGPEIIPIGTSPWPWARRAGAPQ